MRIAHLVPTLLPLVSAHTRFTTLFVNSQSEGDGTCIRMDMNPSTTTDFISSIDSSDMACGVQGDLAVNRTCSLKPGDSVSLLHRLWTDGSQPGSIDPSHKGSTAIYMKKLANVDSADPYSTPASGDGWFKIAWNGFDESMQQWGTEKMIANDGKVEATVPNDLPGGYYLIRSEILSLQNIIDNKVAPQFYAGCAQVYVDSLESGDVNAQTVSIPDYIDSSTPALSYDVYSTAQPAVPYTEFGPTIYGAGGSGLSRLYLRNPGHGRHGFGWPRYNNIASAWRPVSNGASSNSNDSQDDDNSTGAAASTFSAADAVPPATLAGASPSSQSSSSSIASTVQAVQTSSANTATSTTSPSSIIGTCPYNTVLTVANLCLTEIPAWSSDTPGSLPKCWAASQQCWNTNEFCWNNLSPAINADNMEIGCHAWESKCNAIVDWCNAGNLEGPPAWSGGNVNGSNSNMVRRELEMVSRRVASVRSRGLKDYSSF